MNRLLVEKHSRIMKDISNAFNNQVAKGKLYVAPQSSGTLSTSFNVNTSRPKNTGYNRMNRNAGAPPSAAQSEKDLATTHKSANEVVYNNNSNASFGRNSHQQQQQHHQQQQSGYNKTPSNEDSFWKTRSSITDDNDWGSSPLTIKTPFQFNKNNQQQNRSYDMQHQQQRRLYSTSSLNQRPFNNTYNNSNNNSRDFSTSHNNYRSYNNNRKAAASADNWFSVSERSSEYESQIFQEGSMRSGINFDKYDDIPVTIEGKDVEIKPQLDIKDVIMSPVFCENLEIASYTKLTPIQKYAFPCLIERHDLLGCAQTGSGKTVAFVLPILDHIYKEGYYSPKSPYSSRVAVCVPKALILAPTRELANQIHEVAVKFSYRTMIKPAVVYGGVPIKQQYMGLYHSGHVLVGTPGRVFDMYRRGYLSFENCKYLVLDEADRMLDMGFEPQIKEILTSTNMPDKSERLNCMFSATFDRTVMRLVDNYMNNPYVMITIGKIGGTTDNITQTILDIAPHDKFPKLLEHLKTDDKVLVFTETKFEADRVEMSLFESNFKVVCIHGDRGQQERDMALALFKSGKANIMVATGVASRGLDIPDVKKVVLYDCPKNIDDYIHRIGRTGRAGNVGEAITFYSSFDTTIGRELCDILQQAKQEIPSFLKADSRYGGGGQRTGGGSSNYMKFNNSGGGYRRGGGGSNFKQQQGGGTFNSKRNNRGGGGSGYGGYNNDFSSNNNRGGGAGDGVDRERW